MQYYRTVQKNSLQQQWSVIIELAVTSDTRYLQEFYDNLLENWQKQCKWCLNVFGQALTGTACEPTIVLVELLSTIEPTRESLLTQCLKRSNDKLLILQEHSAANIQFGTNIGKLLSIEGNHPSSLIKSLSSAINNWFMVFINQYASMEQTYLTGIIGEIQMVQTTAAESVRALGAANNKIVELCEEALKRCELITQDCGIPALLVVFNVRNFLCNVLFLKHKYFFTVYIQNIS